MEMELQKCDNIYDKIMDKWSEQWIKFIKDNPDKNWDWRAISCNPNITWKIIQDNPNMSWEWYAISAHPNITFDIVQNNPDEPWDWKHLSDNPNINFDIVKNNPDKEWDYYALSSNTMDMARNNFTRKELQQWFKRSELKAELIATVWHPRNFEKFKYLDPDMFDDEVGEEADDEVDTDI